MVAPAENLGSTSLHCVWALMVLSAGDGFGVSKINGGKGLTSGQRTRRHFEMRNIFPLYSLSSRQRRRAVGKGIQFLFNFKNLTFSNFMVNSINQ